MDHFSDLFSSLRVNSYLICKLRPNSCGHSKFLQLQVRPKISLLRIKSDLFQVNHRTQNERSVAYLLPAFV